MGLTLVQKRTEQELMLERINQVEPNISETDIKNINDYLQSGSWITEHKLTEELEKN